MLQILLVLIWCFRLLIYFPVEIPDDCLLNTEAFGLNFTHNVLPSKFTVVYIAELFIDIQKQTAIKYKRRILELWTNA